MNIACRLAGLAAATSLFMVPAAAGEPAPEPAPQWIAGESAPDTASLSYGVPGSEEEVTLALQCTPHSGSIRIFISETSEAFKPGQKVMVTFAIGAVKAAFQGKMTANEMAGVPSAETRAPSADRLFRAMTGGETLAIAIGAWSTTIPLKGIGDKAAALTAACDK